MLEVAFHGRGIYERLHLTNRRALNPLLSALSALGVGHNIIPSANASFNPNAIGRGSVCRVPTSVLRLLQHRARQDRMVGVDDEPMALRIDEHIHILHRDRAEQRFGVAWQDDRVEI